MLPLHLMVSDQQRMAWFPPRLACVAVASCGGLALQIVTRSHAAAFFVLCCILLFYTKNNSCATYSMAWVGFAPVQVYEWRPAGSSLASGASNRVHQPLLACTRPLAIAAVYEPLFLVFLI